MGKTLLRFVATFADDYHTTRLSLPRPGRQEGAAVQAPREAGRSAIQEKSCLYLFQHLSSLENFIVRMVFRSGNRVEPVDLRQKMLMSASCPSGKPKPTTMIAHVLNVHCAKTDCDHLSPARRFVPPLTLNRPGPEKRRVRVDASGSRICESRLPTGGQGRNKNGGPICRENQGNTLLSIFSQVLYQAELPRQMGPPSQAVFLFDWQDYITW